MFRHKARLYYCIHCKWSFLVCERQVVVLDEHGNPLAGAQGSERFDTLEEGPCPGLAALQPHPPVTVYVVHLKPGRNHNESNNLAANNVSAGSVEPRPVLRLHTRLRKNIGASP